MSQKKRLESISKFLSLVLRHAPETIGMRLDNNGWAGIGDLLERAAQHGKSISAAELLEAVATNDKQRFAVSPDGLSIRASQGHSVASVDLDLAVVRPPAVLYHGTATRFVDSIRQTGLRPGSRQHVHLSLLMETAVNVGARHGAPVVLSVSSEAMCDAGHTFYLSDNGVWLTDNVPVSFIAFP